MEIIKKLFVVLAVFILMATTVAAQPELPNPGITPDSPFYFLNRAMDIFRSPEVVMDRRAAEVVAMAEKGHERGLTKALDGYERAVERRERQAEKDEFVAEEVARQTSNHLAILLQVRQRVSEKGQVGIDRALNESVRGRENALNSLEQRNQERAGVVAETTLQELMANTPEAAQEGLQRAIDVVRNGSSQVRSRPADLPVGGNVSGIRQANASERSESEIGQANARSESIRESIGGRS